MGKWRTREAPNKMFQLNDCEEGQFEPKLQAELRAFHTSYECTRNDATGIVDAAKKQSLRDLFSILLCFLQIYAPIPATTSIVERSFQNRKSKCLGSRVVQTRETARTTAVNCRKETPIVHD